MPTLFKISLQVPHSEKDDRYFSFPLHNSLEIESAIYAPSPKIFVVSDIEGNLAPFFEILVAANVISKKMEWTFGDGHLVILGDCFDRGQEVTECLWMIYALEVKSKVFGGKVHFILGNHEIMNMNGDWRYIHPKYATHTFADRFPPTALYAANQELWNWLQTKNIIEKIGSILFVHGGITREVLNLRLSVQEINEIIRPFYLNGEDKAAFDPIARVLFNAESSPFWYRGYYTGQADQQLIDDTLIQYQVHTIVTGHTMLDKVASFFQDKVIDVNTDYANGVNEGLMIIKDRFFRLEPSGHGHRIKKA